MSLLYQAHRSLGVYSSGVPLSVKEVENGEFYIFSAVRHHFSVYKMSDLAIISTSDRLEETIISMTSTKNMIFCGCQNKIFAFKRAKHVFRKFSYEDKKNWKIVVALESEGTLCAVSESNMLVIWSIASGKKVFTCQFPEDEFDICQILQPKGYTNKILVASRQGKVHLVNYITRSTLYVFDLDKPLTVLVEAPHEHTVAFGCEDGTVLLHNVLYDKTLITLHQDLGSVSSIAFRTESQDELIMLTGTKNGHVTLWNIDKQRNIGQTRNCHHEAISTLFCVPGKPLLITSSPDNSIKIWNYDRPDGSPVLHNSRQGHWLPPSFIQYWPSGTLSKEIISGGQDSVMNVFSTYEDKYNFSMGRGYLPSHGKREDKLTREQYVLPPPKDIACNVIRNGFWDSIVVCHEGHRRVTTWTHSKRCRGKHYLDYSGFRNSEFKYHGVSASNCVISMCGNFTVIGYSSGHLVKFNIQSGLERGVFGEVTGHEDAVTGLVVGLSGHLMVLVSGDSCGNMRMWDFCKRKLLAELSLGSGICVLRVHPNLHMVAVGTKDGYMHFVQLANFVVFHKTYGNVHMRPVKDIAFHHHSEKVVVADGDLIKTFDYIHQKLVDCFRVPSMVTKLVMAPNDAFLVTTHDGDLGLYLWGLRTTYFDVKLVSLSVDYVPEVVVSMPRNKDLDDIDLDKDAFEAPLKGTGKKKVQKTSTELATYCSHPSSYLGNMLNIDHLKIQSEMASRGVSSSSFFLSQMTETLGGIKWKDEDNGVMTIFAKEKKRKADETKCSDIVAVDGLHHKMISASSDQEFDDLMSVLTKLTASSADHEIKMLHPMYHMSTNMSNFRIDAFLTLLINQFRRVKNLDLCETYFAILLKHNGYCLLQDEHVQEEDDDHKMNQTKEDPFDMDQDEKSQDMKRRIHTQTLMKEAVRTMEEARGSMIRKLNKIEQMVSMALMK